MKNILLVFLALALTVAGGCAFPWGKKDIPLMSKPRDIKVTQNEISKDAKTLAENNAKEIVLNNDSLIVVPKIADPEVRDRVKTNLVRMDDLLKADKPIIENIQKQAILLDDPSELIEKLKKENSTLKEDKTKGITIVWVAVGGLGAIIVALGVLCAAFYRKDYGIGGIIAGIALSSLSFLFISNSWIFMVIGGIIVIFLGLHMSKNVPNSKKSVVDSSLQKPQ